MSRLFDHDPVPEAKRFAGDISKWDVSRVTNMVGMFSNAPLFNGDISGWDVSSVSSMDAMFLEATAFSQTLCGAWLTSTADKNQMFDGSSGRIGSPSTSCSTTTANPKCKTASLNSASF